MPFTDSEDKTLNVRTLGIAVAIIVVAGILFLIFGRSGESITEEIAVPGQSAEQKTAGAPPAQTQADTPTQLAEPAPAQKSAPVRDTQQEIDTATPAGGLPLQLDTIAGTLRIAIGGVKAEGERLPLEHSCYREKKSPGIGWRSAPSSTQSYVVMMEKRGEGANPELRWALFNIPANAKGLPAGLDMAALPAGIRAGQNVRGDNSYFGPCDPQGKVPYVIRVFALDKMLDTPAGASRDDLVRAMNGHIVDTRNYSLIHYRRF